jgi:hypothetical protein
MRNFLVQLRRPDLPANPPRHNAQAAECFEVQRLTLRGHHHSSRLHNHHVVGGNSHLGANRWRCAERSGGRSTGG